MNKNNRPKKSRGVGDSNVKLQTLKFMQTVTVGQWGELKALARVNDVTVQEYIRIFIIGPYLKNHSTLRSRKAKMGWRKRRLNQRKIKPRKEDWPTNTPLPTPTPKQLHQMETEGPFRPIGRSPTIATS